MINLFKRIYVSYDTDLRAGKTQQRIFVTARPFPYPISNDDHVRRTLGILEYYDSVAKFYKELGGLQEIVRMLHGIDEKVCLITEPRFATLLSACVFKSLVKNPTVEAAYLLYRTTYNHQRASSLQTVTNFDDDLSLRTPFPAMYSLEEYRVIYNEAVLCGSLRTIDPKDIPIEYLMANYFSTKARQDKLGTAFLSKYKDIALENAVFRIRTLRNTILTNTISVSAYLGKQVDSIDAVDELMKHPETKWLADESLSIYNDTDALTKYSIAELLSIYDSIEDLLKIRIEERPILVYLGMNNPAGLVMVDSYDGLGNFLSAEHHTAKINGVFINKCYQERTAGGEVFFQQFALRSELN